MNEKDLKETWKKTGVGLGHAFRDLGKSIVKSVAAGMEKADEWANGDDAADKKPADSEPKTAEPVDSE